jgi:four helix bundle protein
MTTNELKLRTKKFSLEIIELVEKLPNSIACRTISNQIIRSGTSVGANYRAVCRARSDREFVSKMNIVLEEADETVFWLEIIVEKKWLNESETLKILDEGNQLTAIFVSSLKTVNSRMSNPKI